MRLARNLRPRGDTESWLLGDQPIISTQRHKIARELRCSRQQNGEAAGLVTPPPDATLANVVEPRSLRPIRSRPGLPTGFASPGEASGGLLVSAARRRADQSDSFQSASRISTRARDGRGTVNRWPTPVRGLIQMPVRHSPEKKFKAWKRRGARLTSSTPGFRYRDVEQGRRMRLGATWDEADTAVRDHQPAADGSSSDRAVRALRVDDGIVVFDRLRAIAHGQNIAAWTVSQATAKTAFRHRHRRRGGGHRAVARCSPPVPASDALKCSSRATSSPGPRPQPCP